MIELQKILQMSFYWSSFFKNRPNVYLHAKSIYQYIYIYLSVRRPLCSRAVKSGLNGSSGRP